LGVDTSNTTTMPSPSLDENHERASYLLPPSCSCTSSGCRQCRHMIRWPRRCRECDRSCHCHHPPSEPPWHWYLDLFSNASQKCCFFSSILFPILIVFYIIYYLWKIWEVWFHLEFLPQLIITVMEATSNIIAKLKVGLRTKVVYLCSAIWQLSIWETLNVYTLFHSFYFVDLAYLSFCFPILDVICVLEWVKRVVHELVLGWTLGKENPLFMYF